MAINPENIDIVTVDKLQSAPLATTRFFAHVETGGQLKKATLGDLATFLSPYVSAVGGSGYVQVTGTALPTPAGSAISYTIVDKDTYTQTTGGNVNATGDFNILGFNGTTWSLISPISIPQYLEPNPSLLIYSNIVVGQYVNGIGDVGLGTGYSTSDLITVDENKSYILDGLTNGTTYSLRFENASGTKIGFSNNSSFPVTIPMIPGTAKVRFTVKDVTDSVQPSNVTFKDAASYIGSNSATPLRADELSSGATMGGVQVATLNDSLVEDTSVNLINTANYVNNQAVDSAGAIQSYAGYMTSGYISVTALQDYTISNLPSGGSAPYSIRFENSSNALVGVLNPTVFPYTFNVPATAVRLKFTVKLDTDSSVNPNVKISLTSTDVIQSKDAPLLADKLNPDGLMNGISFKTLISALPFKGKKATFYGDSTIADNSPGYSCYLLESLFKQMTGVTSVTRRGQSGTDYRDQLSGTTLMAPVVADAPDLLVIESLNDFRLDRPVGTIDSPSGEASTAGGIQRMFDYFISNLPNTKIVICTPYAFGKVAGVPSSKGANELNAQGVYLAAYADVIKAKCNRNGISYIDLTTTLLVPATETAAPTKTFDGIHLTAYGMNLFASIIANNVNKYYV